MNSICCLSASLVLQVRAMQIIDELEANKRGPYGGGIGHVSFTGARCKGAGARSGSKGAGD